MELRTRISAEEHCEQRSSSEYSLDHCKGLSGHTPFILHLLSKHAHTWHDMNDSVTYRKTIMCSVSNEALALLKLAAESFFLLFLQVSIPASLSSSECARKTQPDGRL